VKDKNIFSQGKGYNAEDLCLPFVRFSPREKVEAHLSEAEKHFFKKKNQALITFLGFNYNYIAFNSTDSNFENGLWI
jgi:hypothetical protein